MNKAKQAKVLRDSCARAAPARGRSSFPKKLAGAALFAHSQTGCAPGAHGFEVLLTNRKKENKVHLGNMKKENVAADEKKVESITSSLSTAKCTTLATSSYYHRCKLGTDYDPLKITFWKGAKKGDAEKYAELTKTEPENEVKADFWKTDLGFAALDTTVSADSASKLFGLQCANHDKENEWMSWAYQNDMTGFNNFWKGDKYDVLELQWWRAPCITNCFFGHNQRDRKGGEVKIVGKNCVPAESSGTGAADSSACMGC
ncbi:unnamed protein product [Amoebophrya sp. A120]|nr:unnamed protein product [Amoebophrya sp. A120]|eukprot:GSA120T00022164001.1